ncbi:MAG: glycosyltransferase family 4 protein [Chloroflexi bacterium]|nr:glycosyltransferase family 4 protein [Chloroflexota bacterium]
MRVLMVSKACIVGQYQTKLQALARHPDLELTVVVPPFWQDERGVVPLERGHTDGYRLQVEPLTLNGHFHLHFYPTLPNLMRRLRPHIVHIDEEPYNFATYHAARAAQSVQAKTIFFTWQNIKRHYPPPFAWFQAYVFRRAAYAIAGNREAAEVLRAKNYHGPMRVIPQFGLDPDQFTPNHTARSANAPFRIGYIGRFVEEKGLEVLVRAVAGLQGDWELQLLGGGPLKSKLKTWAQDLQIADRVRIDKWLPSAEMPAYYRQLDLLVLPSLTCRNWKEQFGRILTEAMACEVPVIGSDCGEIPNVVGDAGLLVPEGDASALRAQIESLCSNPERRATLGARGRARVLKHFTQEQVAAETYEVYRHILVEETR